MREHTLECHGGVFSEDKTEDYEFILLNSHGKVIRRQQGRGVLMLGRRVYRVNRGVLNSKFEHWRPKPVFIVGR